MHAQGHLFSLHLHHGEAGKVCIGELAHPRAFLLAVSSAAASAFRCPVHAPRACEWLPVEDSDPAHAASIPSPFLRCRASDGSGRCGRGSRRLQASISP